MCLHSGALEAATAADFELRVYWNARPCIIRQQLAYRRKDPSSANSIACCAAQMFLDSGDGIVFMGEYGPWYSPEWDAFHLTPQAARRLLEGVLETYRELEGQPLREIFLHSRSGFNHREFEGFQQACPSGVDLVPGGK